MNSMARGLTLPEGREPALNASTLPAPYIRANASAICERLLFSMQTKRTRFMDRFRVGWAESSRPTTKVGLRRWASKTRPTLRSRAAWPFMHAATRGYRDRGAEHGSHQIDPQTVQVGRHERRRQRASRVHRGAADRAGEQRFQT